MYPLARLDKVTWMDEEPERTGESIQTLWLDFGRDTIKVAGGNLSGLRDALLLGTVDFIQQWDGSSWPEEPDEEGPVVWELMPTLRGVREREADGTP